MSKVLILKCFFSIILPCLLPADPSLAIEYNHKIGLSDMNKETEPTHGEAYISAKLPLRSINSSLKDKEDGQSALLVSGLDLGWKVDSNLSLELNFMRYLELNQNLTVDTHNTEEKNTTPLPFHQLLTSTYIGCSIK